MFAYVRFMSAVAGVALFAASWGWNSGRAFQREKDEEEVQEAIIAQRAKFESQDVQLDDGRTLHITSTRCKDIPSARTVELKGSETAEALGSELDSSNDSAEN